jgi:hypothetical protein
MSDSPYISDQVAEEIATDDDNPARNTERIIAAYESASTEIRAVVDDIFTSLCGYSLQTLIMRAKGTDDEAEDAEPPCLYCHGAGDDGEGEDCTHCGGTGIAMAGAQAAPLERV